MSCVDEIQYIMVKHISFIYKKNNNDFGYHYWRRERDNQNVYTCTYVSLISMTNKSVMTFLYVNKICVCLSVWFNCVFSRSASSRLIKIVMFFGQSLGQYIYA